MHHKQALDAAPKLVDELAKNTPTCADENSCVENREVMRQRTFQW